VIDFVEPVGPQAANTVISAAARILATRSSKRSIGLLISNFMQHLPFTGDIRQ
jgi:hypothetical protein